MSKYVISSKILSEGQGQSQSQVEVKRSELSKIFIQKEQRLKCLKY